MPRAARGTRTSQTKEPLGVERTDVSLPLVAMMAALVLSATPVAAEPNPAFNRAVSGPVVGTTFVDFLTSGCGLVHQTVDGTYTTAKGETGRFTSTCARRSASTAARWRSEASRFAIRAARPVHQGAEREIGSSGATVNVSELSRGWSARA
jgi:hypothetical protein